MKKCPVCKSVVHAESECPVCQTTLTYEPPVMEEKEHIAWNKYYFLYLIKNIWFSLLCCITGISVYVASQPKIDYLFGIAIFFAAVSLYASIFQRKLIKNMKQKYSDEYITFRIGKLKYFSGGIAILFFIITGFMA